MEKPRIRSVPPFLQMKPSVSDGVSKETLEQGSGENVLLHNSRFYMYSLVMGARVEISNLPLTVEYKVIVNTCTAIQ